MEKNQNRAGEGVFKKVSHLRASAINTFETVSLIVGVGSLAVLLIVK